MSDRPVTIVTGAGSGIGRALAILLAERNYRLVLAGRTQVKLAETERLCAAAGPAHQAVTYECDISKWDQASALVDHALGAFGALDVIVNCAGVAPMADIADTDATLVEHAFRCNAFGAAAIVARAWPHFVRRKSGCIVNISSYATIDPFPGFFVYAASKAALDSMTRSCHVEGAQHGIRAFTVNPGAVETPMLRALFPHDVLPAERALHPREVAEVAVECIEGRREDKRGAVLEVVRR